MEKTIILKPIGSIRTPYKKSFVPHQPVEREEGESRLVLNPEYHEGLRDLEEFSHIYVFFYCDRESEHELSMTAAPSWAKGKEVGLFASRSPHRPNRIALSIVKIKRIENHEIYTNLIDAYDQTPLLDIKPYIKDLDCKKDANNGWISQIENHQHQLDHMMNKPHDHQHTHEQGHKHEHHEHGHQHHHDDDDQHHH